MNRIVQTDTLDTLINVLCEQQWVRTSSYFAPMLSQQLYEEAHQLYTAGHVRSASIGQGRQAQENQDIRQTHIYWFEPTQLSAAQRQLWTELEHIKERLNQTCFLNLVEFECHYALYPLGAFYRRHLDQFRFDKRRQVSFSFYLNPAWQPEDGGCLRLYLHTEKPQTIDILPEANTFVLFQSAALEHEVLVTQRTRYAVVGWMKTRPAHGK